MAHLAAVGAARCMMRARQHVKRLRASGRATIERKRDGRQADERGCWHRAKDSFRFANEVSVEGIPSLQTSYEALWASRRVSAPCWRFIVDIESVSR